ncbi:hypothetical protein [Streptomyces sp. NBC_00887]|uniref:hypothetical protein n=1 Tax=Streptomyces sp. NBC_00887 TaxID=2975859 RepID=UPI003867CE2F|nr:hypothetical protein OG844_01645 [Streptomyces sp. NBC_00887]WSY36145.1 hypothetical protein OG844_43955 [Streptomyces sp. NBC_00887]
MELAVGGERLEAGAPAGRLHPGDDHRSSRRRSPLFAPVSWTRASGRREDGVRVGLGQAYSVLRVASSTETVRTTAVNSVATTSNESFSGNIIQTGTNSYLLAAPHAQ